METLFLVLLVILTVTVIYLINKINKVIDSISLHEEIITLFLKDYKNRHSKDEIDQFILNFIEDK